MPACSRARFRSHGRWPRSASRRDGDVVEVSYLALEERPPHRHRGRRPVPLVPFAQTLRRSTRSRSAGLPIDVDWVRGDLSQVPSYGILDFLSASGRHRYRRTSCRLPAAPSIGSCEPTARWGAGRPGARRVQRRPARVPRAVATRASRHLERAKEQRHAILDEAGNGDGSVVGRSHLRVQRTPPSSKDSTTSGPVSAGQHGPSNLIASGWIFRNQSQPSGPEPGRRIPTIRTAVPHRSASARPSPEPGAPARRQQLGDPTGRSGSDQRRCRALLSAERRSSLLALRKRGLQLRYSQSGGTSTGLGAGGVGNFTTLLLDLPDHENTAGRSTARRCRGAVDLPSVLPHAAVDERRLHGDATIDALSVGPPVRGRSPSRAGKPSRGRRR
jgi:hypothetical protein